ncbi:hypothetical protein LTR28_009380, partial [Elasticomyces elasticus]
RKISRLSAATDSRLRNVRRLRKEQITRTGEADMAVREVIEAPTIIAPVVASMLEVAGEDNNVEVEVNSVAEEATMVKQEDVETRTSRLTITLAAADTAAAAAAVCNT